jgi:hypothetical protein
LSSSVSRHFATLGETQVHYRRAGLGPAVLLLHQSPSSSAELVPLIAAVDMTRDPELQATLRASCTAPAADSHGGYLLRAWHEARDHLLFFPWYDRRRACALADSLCLEPKFLQARTVDALLAGAAGVALRRVEIGYPLLARLAELRVEPRHAHSRGLSGAAREFLTLSRDPERWGGELESFIHSEPTPP